MDSSRGTAPSRFFFIHRFDDPLPCRWDTMNHESGTSIGWKSRPAALERCKKKQKRKAHHSIGAAIRVSVMRALCSRIWKRGVAERIDRRSIVHFGPAGDCVLLVCWFFFIIRIGWRFIDSRGTQVAIVGCDRRAPDPKKSLSIRSDTTDADRTWHGVLFLFR